MRGTTSKDGENNSGKVMVSNFIVGISKSGVHQIFTKNVYIEKMCRG